jgi:hypothetical protein
MTIRVDVYQAFHTLSRRTLLWYVYGGRISECQGLQSQNSAFKIPLHGYTALRTVNETYT